MDKTQLCSANRLESLELDSLTYNCLSDVDAFMKAMDFLFPTPNKETGIHHFSRLRCLKLWEFSVEGLPDDDDEEEVDKEIKARVPFFEDEKRLEIAFPNLRGFALRSSERALWGPLLRSRGPLLESLHLSGDYFYASNELPSFDSLSELCLAGDNSLPNFVEICREKEENGKHLSKVDKLSLNLGVRHIQLRGFEVRDVALLIIRDVMNLVLKPSRFEASKFIRLNLRIASGWEGAKKEITMPSIRVIMDKIVQTISSQRKLSGGRRFESLSFHFEVKCDYQGTGKPHIPGDYDVGLSEKLGEELAMGIPLYLRIGWIGWRKDLLFPLSSVRGIILWEALFEGV